MSSAHSPSFPSLHLRHSSFSNPSLTLPTSQLILQPFRWFTYVAAHSPTLPLLDLRHSSFSNPSFASPTSPLILQPFFRFSFVRRFSLTSPGEPPMLASTSLWAFMVCIGGGTFTLILVESNNWIVYCNVHLYLVARKKMLVETFDLWHFFRLFLNNINKQWTEPHVWLWMDRIMTRLFRRTSKPILRYLNCITCTKADKSFQEIQFNTKWT